MSLPQDLLRHLNRLDALPAQRAPLLGWIVSALELLLRAELARQAAPQKNQHTGGDNGKGC